MPVGIQLSGLALYGNVLAVTAAHPHCVYTDVGAMSAREMLLTLRPVRPTPALNQIPLADMRSDLDSEFFQPGTSRGLRTHLVNLNYGRFDYVLRRVLH